MMMGLYTRFVSDAAQRLGISILNFPILRPHNRVIVVDRNHIHVILSLSSATPGYRDEKIRDFRNKVLSPSALIDACKRELGYTEVHYFSFPSEFLDLPEEELKRKINEIADKEVTEVHSSLSLLNQAGFGEAFKYLRNAKLRLSSGEPTGFADCKTNCRNALISAIKAITDQEKVRDGIKLMAKEGYFGERGRILSRLRRSRI